MARNKQSRNWEILGPQALGWLRAEVPKRRDLQGVWPDLAAFLGGGISREGAAQAVRRNFPAQWAEIEATAGTGKASVEAAQEVTKSEKDGEIEARANGRTIRTVEDLLKHIEADMAKYEIASSEATKYEAVTKGEDGKPVVTELFRVFVRLKPKAGPTVPEAITAMIEGAFAKRRPPAVHTVPKTLSDILEVLIVADPHFGKYAWGASTGGPDYDLNIARSCVEQAGMELLDRGDRAYHPEKRVLGFLGDVFHYDTPGGTTTGGTAMERDGRYQKMLRVGSDTCIGLVERSARTCPTEVIVIPGNHDQILTAAFQLILQAWFRNDARVAVDDGHLPRKYLKYGANLIGFAHGEKAKKKLPQLMALERPKEWGETAYREIHTGHLHYQAAEWQKPIETIDGVVVRIAPSVGPSDDWHVEEGFIGAPRAMETYLYRKSGGLAGILLSSPDFPSAEPQERAG